MASSFGRTTFVEQGLKDTVVVVLAVWVVLYEIFEPSSHSPCECVRLCFSALEHASALCEQIGIPMDETLIISVVGSSEVEVIHLAGCFL